MEMATNMEQKSVVTTGRKCQEKSRVLAQKTAARLGLPFVERGNASFGDLCRIYGVKFVLVAKQDQLMLETEGGEMFFHPNISHLRIKNLCHGACDHMANAMDLQQGMSILDCTLGFGADAIVASYITGKAGRVLGLESSPLIEAVVSYGLAHFPAKKKETRDAMRRIETCHADAVNFLREQEKDSWDIVYFDPMFRHPLMESSSLAPLRFLADPRPLSKALVQEALRVARHRVVMKENSRSLEFERLGFNHTAGGTYSSVKFGYIEKGT